MKSEGHLRPSEVLADMDGAIRTCRQTQRLTPCAFSVDMEMTDEQEYYARFAACCKVAKAVKVVTLTVRAAELGTPFNAEVERLRALAGHRLDGRRPRRPADRGRTDVARPRHRGRALRQRPGPGHSRWTPAITSAARIAAATSNR